MNEPTITRLPRELRSLVDSELEPGETISWAAQPIPGRMARRMVPAVLFGIPFTAFAIFWTAGASSMMSGFGGGGGLFSLFPMFGLIFVFVGVGLLTSPFWAGRSARGSAYVITDRRAIIIGRNWLGTTHVRSFAPAGLGDLRRNQHGDGSGDLVFTQDLRRDGDGHRWSTDIGFLAIRDVKRVEALVRALAARSPGSSAELGGRGHERAVP